MRKTILFLILLSLALTFGFASGSGEKEDLQASSAPVESYSGVVFEAQDLNGNKVSHDIFKGTKLTMLNVWATYCNPCLSEMPGLGELAREYDKEDFQLIGVVSDIPEGVDGEIVEALSAFTMALGADTIHIFY